MVSHYIALLAGRTRDDAVVEPTTRNMNQQMSPPTENALTSPTARVSARLAVKVAIHLFIFHFQCWTPKGGMWSARSTIAYYMLVGDIESSIIKLYPVNQLPVSSQNM